jgi:hypothetical protein
MVARLNLDELRYVLDPQEVYGSDFPGETFRVLTKSPSFGGRRRRSRRTESFGRGDWCWRSGMRWQDPTTDSRSDKRTETDGGRGAR